MWHDRFHPTTAQWGQKQTSNNPVEYASIYFVGSGVYGCGKCETIHLNIKAYILQTAVYMGAASVNQCSWISAVESVQTAVYMAVALVKQSTWILKRVFCRQRCIWQWQVWNNPLEYKSVYFADSGVHDSGTCETIQLNIKACILQTAVYMTVARVKPIQLNIKAYILQTAVYMTVARVKQSSWMNIKAYILQTAVYMGAASVDQCSWRCKYTL